MCRGGHRLTAASDSRRVLGGVSRILPRHAPRRLAGHLCAVALLGGAAPLRAQDAPGCQRVGRIEIRSHGLFAREELARRRFGRALGLANRLHLHTRPDLARGLLLLAEGDCYDANRVADSARRLRDLPFVARAEAAAHQEPDSTWTVRVQLWDEWSTELSPDFDVENRFLYKGFLLSEGNLLGRGVRASVRWRDFREDRIRLGTLSTTRFLGTQAFAAVSGGVTRLGTLWRQEVTRPWLDEGPGYSATSRVQAEDRPFSYLTGRRQGMTHAVLPLDDRSWQLRLQQRTGVLGALRVRGAEVEVVRRTVAGAPQQVNDWNFLERTPAAGAVLQELAAQGAPDSWVRVGAVLGWRRIRYGAEPGLDLMSAPQTIAGGSEVTLTVGRTVATWNSSPPGSYVRAEGYATRSAGPWLLHGLLTGRAVRFDRATRGGSPWRELGTSGRGVAYLRLPPAARHRLVAGTRFDLRARNDQPYQRTLGGEEGVRGYTDEQLPAGSTLVLFAEDRLDLPWLRPAADLGLTGFADYGRGWRSGVPYGMDTGWRLAVGGGVRFAFPAGSGTVWRMELAWPVGAERIGRGPVFRTYWSPVLTLR